MNTNRTSMTWRCPGAIPFGHARLLDHEFRFSHHADVVVSVGNSVDGVLWLIDEDHLADLDILESYPSYYDRNILPVEYFVQTQGQLLVTGKQWVDFVSYYPGMKALIIRAKPDKVFQIKLKKELERLSRDLNKLAERIK